MIRWEPSIGTAAWMLYEWLSLIPCRINLPFLLEWTKGFFFLVVSTMFDLFEYSITLKTFERAITIIITFTDNSYPFSEMPWTLLRVDSAPSNAAFCMQFIVIVIPIVLKCSSRLSLIIPRVPKKLGITVALTYHSFYSCNLRSLH